jgi:hypothetical protein
MLQSKLGSFYEACMNIAIGYCVATLGNYLILPYFLEGVTFANSLEIGLWFTALSLARQYIVRRWFNERLRKAAIKLAS